MCPSTFKTFADMVPLRFALTMLEASLVSPLRKKTWQSDTGDKPPAAAPIPPESQW